MTTLTLDPALEARIAVVASQEGRDVSGTATAILDMWLREREEEIEELRAMVNASIAEAGRDGWLTDEQVGQSLAEERAAFETSRR